MQLFLMISLFSGAIALDFQGTGQLRMLQGVPSSGRGNDLGCLNSVGRWTADNTQCEVFSGTRTGNFSISLNTTAGVPCGRDNIDFICQAGLQAEYTGWALFFGGISVIPGRDVLGWGEYGLMSSTADYVPETAADAPVVIQFYGDVTPQPWAYIGWLAE